MAEIKEIPQWAKDLELDINKNTHEFEGKEYPLDYDDEREERFIEVIKEKDKKQKHYLIESQEQIDNRMQKNDYNFSYYIFTCIIDFSKFEFIGYANFWGTKFIKKVSFQGTKFSYKAQFVRAKFIEEVNFTSAKFIEEVNFVGAKFMGYASFIGAKFTEAAYFTHVIYTKRVSFGAVTFSKVTNFKYAEFIEKGSFEAVQFTKEANFFGTQFTKEANFKGAKFLGFTSFYLAKINTYLIFDEINKNKNELDFSNFKLDLTSTMAANITYSNHNITNVENRKTWLVLCAMYNDHLLEVLRQR